VEAYLCQSEYVAVLITCLRAVEQNNPALLADVNPALVCFFTVSVYVWLQLWTLGKMASAFVAPSLFAVSPID